MDFFLLLWLFLLIALVLTSNPPDNGRHESNPNNGGIKRSYNETNNRVKVAKYSSVGVKKPRSFMFTFEEVLRYSFLRALQLDVNEFIDFLEKNYKKDPESIDFTESIGDYKQLFLFLKDIFKDFGGSEGLGTCETSLLFKEFTLYTFNQVQISMDEFLKFLGFKKRSDTAEKVRAASSGLIADLFYQGTLDLFAPWMEQDETRAKYYLFFERIIASETRPHDFKYQRAYLLILPLLYDILNDPLLRKLKDIKNAQSDDPSSALKTAFQKALGLDLFAFRLALDEYCKTKKSPERTFQPKIADIFDDFKDYYCEHCYIRSRSDGISKKRISSFAKIQALSKGVCNFIKSKLGIGISVFLTKNLRI